MTSAFAAFAGEAGPEVPVDGPQPDQFANHDDAEIARSVNVAAP